MANYKLLNKPAEYCFRAAGYLAEVLGIGGIAWGMAVNNSDSPRLLISGVGIYVCGRIIERAVDRRKRKEERLEQKLKEE